MGFTPPPPPPPPPPPSLWQPTGITVGAWEPTEHPLIKRRRELKQKELEATVLTGVVKIADTVAAHVPTWEEEIEAMLSFDPLSKLDLHRKENLL